VYLFSSVLKNSSEYRHVKAADFSFNTEGTNEHGVSQRGFAKRGTEEKERLSISFSAESPVGTLRLVFQNNH
jgi:hypothetical protein